MEVITLEREWYIIKYSSRKFDIALNSYKLLIKFNLGFLDIQIILRYIIFYPSLYIISCRKFEKLRKEGGKKNEKNGLHNIL